MAAATEAGGLFSILSPDETALDVLHRSHKTAVRTAVPLLEPVRPQLKCAACAGAAPKRAQPPETTHESHPQALGGAAVLPGDFVEVLGEPGVGKTKVSGQPAPLVSRLRLARQMRDGSLETVRSPCGRALSTSRRASLLRSQMLMQCVVDAVLPRCLGGQGARVFWMDVDLKFNARQMGRMLGFEIMARCASGAFPEAGGLVPPGVIESIAGSADPGPGLSGEQRRALDHAVDDAVVLALRSVVVLPCASTTEFAAAFAAVEARLALRRHTWAALVIDSMSSMQMVWRGHEPLGGASAFILALRAARRLRRTHALTCFVSRAEAGRCWDVGREGLSAALAASGPTADERLAAAVTRALEDESASPPSAPPLTALSAAADASRGDDDDDAWASRSGDATSRLFSGVKRPWDVAPRVWQEDATHRVRLYRVETAEDTSWEPPGAGPFAQLGSPTGVARLLRARPGAAIPGPSQTPPTRSSAGAAPGRAERLPQRQLWPFVTCAAGLVDTELL